MGNLSRRSMLRSSLRLAAASALVRPHIANAAATTAEVWWVQGFAKEEDSSFIKMVAEYEKASGNKIDYSLIPFAPMRQKVVSAIESGVVPDIMNTPDLEFGSLQSWNDKLLDVSDIVETQKKDFVPIAIDSCFLYNGVTKRRSYSVVPLRITGWPFHIWGSLVEKAGYKISDLPNTWDAFLDFFKPVQDKLRAQGMRNMYAYGYQLTANGVDPIATYNAFLIAYGGKDFVTPDGKLNTDNPQVRAAAAKAIERLTTPFKEGYVPPGVVNWNDADDNNAFHAKLMVMDFDGTISTEVAIYDKKEDYDAIVTRGLPLGNDGKPLTAQIITDGAAIPKGAKNIPAAKEFLKYMVEPKVLNEWLKGGLGRFMLPIPEIVQSDPFWLK
jgi:multiple sugar transport system substrate-binding protein